MLEFEPSAEPADYLTPEETAEFERIQREPSVVGYALIDMDGSEIVASGIMGEMAAAVFANIFSITDRIGDEFGETDSSSMMFVESDAYEIAAITMTRAKAVFAKRKGPKVSGGLRSVS